MKTIGKAKSCSNFKPIDEYISHYKNPILKSCNGCVYFSSRNCGFDVSDNLESDFDFF